MGEDSEESVIDMINIQLYVQRDIFTEVDVLFFGKMDEKTRDD